MSQTDGRTDGQTEIWLPRAPVGAKNLFPCSDCPFVSPHRVSNASKEGSCEGKTIFHHWCCLCCNCVCTTPGEGSLRNCLILSWWSFLGPQFLFHPDPSAVATHLLLQHLGPKCSRQGKVNSDYILSRLHCVHSPTEGDLLVQSRLGQRPLEPAWPCHWNSIWHGGPLCQHVSLNQRWKKNECST